MLQVIALRLIPVLAFSVNFGLALYKDRQISVVMAKEMDHVSKAKKAMIDFENKNGHWPQRNKDIDIPASSMLYGDKVKSIVIADGKIILTFSEKHIKNKSLVFTPHRTEKGVSWACTSNELPRKYFRPTGECR